VRADWHHQQILNIDTATGVRATAKDLYLGQRQQYGLIACEVTPER
jgi:hypothetical protein